MTRQASGDLIAGTFLLGWLAVVAATFGILAALAIAAVLLGVAAALPLWRLLGILAARLRRDRARRARIHDRVERISQEEVRPFRFASCAGCRLADEAGPGAVLSHYRGEHMRRWAA